VTRVYLCDGMFCKCASASMCVRVHMYTHTCILRTNGWYTGTDYKKCDRSHKINKHLFMYIGRIIINIHTYVYTYIHTYNHVYMLPYRPGLREAAWLVARAHRNRNVYKPRWTRGAWPFYPSHAKFEATGCWFIWGIVSNHTFMHAHIHTSHQIHAGASVMHVHKSFLQQIAAGFRGLYCIITVFM
jgi:hypothetical protein